MKLPFDQGDKTIEYETETNDIVVAALEPKLTVSYELLRQLVSNHFLTVSVRRTATPAGLIEKPIFSMVNQSGRGREKMSLEISFCPITGVSLDTVDFGALKVDGQISF